jgi:hypothetical protein
VAQGPPFIGEHRGKMSDRVALAHVRATSVESGARVRGVEGMGEGWQRPAAA